MQSVKLQSRYYKVWFLTCSVNCGLLNVNLYAQVVLKAIGNTMNYKLIVTYKLLFFQVAYKLYIIIQYST